MGNSSSRVPKVNDLTNCIKSDDLIQHINGSVDYLILYIQEVEYYNSEWHYITNKFQKVFLQRYQQLSFSNTIIYQQHIFTWNNNHDWHNKSHYKEKSNSNSDVDSMRLDEDYDDDDDDDDEDEIEGESEIPISVGSISKIKDENSGEIKDGSEKNKEEKQEIDETETTVENESEEKSKPKKQVDYSPAPAVLEEEEEVEEVDIQLRLDRQEIIYDAKISSEFPLGMHVVNGHFHYHFYVPDCRQSRSDFIEINHIPVSDMLNDNELTLFLQELGYTNSACEPHLYRIPAKETSNHRKIISLICKFDIEIRISDCFWSNKGLKVRAYKLIGPTWTSVFSAYCFYERTSGIPAIITTDMQADHFVDKVVQSNRFFCPDFRNMDNYCMDFPNYFSSHSKPTEIE